MLLLSVWWWLLEVIYLFILTNVNIYFLILGLTSELYLENLRPCTFHALAHSVTSIRIIKRAHVLPLNLTPCLQFTLAKEIIYKAVFAEIVLAHRNKAVAARDGKDKNTHLVLWQLRKESAGQQKNCLQQ